MARGSIGRKDVSNFLSDLFEGDVHAKRVQSMANATVGVLTSASLGVHAIGQGLAHACDLMPKHAVKQVDRLLSNQGIEVWDYFAYWVPYVVGSRTTIVVALDWTMFEGESGDHCAIDVDGPRSLDAAAVEDGAKRDLEGHSDNA